MAMVEIQSVTKLFGPRNRLALWGRGETTRALDDVSICFDVSKIAVLLGPNGSGKTTLLKLISTMLLPDAGRIDVGGSDTDAGAAQVRRMIGFAVGSERSFFPRLTARENLRFFATFEELPSDKTEQRIEEVLRAVNLADDGDKQVMKFSSGMLHRLGIARANLKNPPVLLLDEPSRSLDPAASEELWQMLRSLREGGTTILVASHNFEETATIADRVAVLQNGSLAGQTDFVQRPGLATVREFYFSIAQTPRKKQMAEARA